MRIRCSRDEGSHTFLGHGGWGVVKDLRDPAGRLTAKQEGA